MTSSSSWLESLGRESLKTPSSISKSNYSEFEQEDLVKAVNDNMDSVTKGIEAEANAAADFYAKWHANKTSQLASLAELTKTGGQLAKVGIEYVKAEKEYNDWNNKVQNGTVDQDKDIIKEDERQGKIDNVESQSEIVANQLENEEFSEFEDKDY